MSGDPTLLVRLQLPGEQSHWGHDCGEVAERIVGIEGSVLDAQWSHPAEAWKSYGSRWPRRVLSSDERALIAGATMMTEYGVSLPQPVAEALLEIIKRVSK